MTDLELEVLEHRYRYYVLNEPSITDYEYDLLERKALKEAGPDSPLHKPGSDKASDYPTDFKHRIL